MYEEDIVDGALSEKTVPQPTERGRVIFFAVLSLFTTILIILTLTSAYGFALYIGIPLTLGFILGFKNKISFQFVKTAGSVLLTVMLLSGLLILLGLEGAICIIMIVLPLFLFIFVGYGLGYIIYKNNLQKNKTMMSLLLLINPSFCVLDSQLEMYHQEVKTSVIINASKEKIWETLIHPVEYNQHPNVLFKYGVNYPKTMQVVKSNDSALLRCTLRNGNIDLYIDKMIRDSLMEFQITEPLIPIKELTVYKHIHTPHSSEKFFKVHTGVFEISTLNDNQCMLTAKTDLSFKFAPNWYWKWWCSYLMNKMHQHVLDVIKGNTELTVFAKR